MSRPTAAPAHWPYLDHGTCAEIDAGTQRNTQNARDRHPLDDREGAGALSLPLRPILLVVA
jgi:hypothetical protein